MVFEAILMHIDDDISDTVDFKKIRMNLKKLRCAAIIINILGCCTLTTLELAPDLSYESYNYSVQLLIDFLSQQKGFISAKCI